MQIRLNSDNNIPATEALATQVRQTVEGAVGRWSEQITRVEVHLSDENGDKTGPADKRCMMEVRIEGRQPIAVTNLAATRDLAIDGAAGKLARLVEHTLARAVHIDRSSRIVGE